MMGLSVEFGSVITTPSEAELTARASRRFSAACIWFRAVSASSRAACSRQLEALLFRLLKFDSGTCRLG